MTLMGSGAVEKRGVESRPRPMVSEVNWALLGLLITRSGYGYQLFKRFEDVYGSVLHLSSESHLYTALDALKTRRLVAEVSGPTGGRQPKRRYRATSKGVQAYRERLIALVAEERRRSQLFMHQLAVLADQPEFALDVLSGYERSCLQQASRTTMASEDSPSETLAGLIAQLTNEEDRLAMPARLEWVEYAREKLEILRERRGR